MQETCRQIAASALPTDQSVTWIAGQGRSQPCCWEPLGPQGHYKLLGHCCCAKPVTIEQLQASLLKVGGSMFEQLSGSQHGWRGSLRAFMAAPSVKSYSETISGVRVHESAKDIVLCRGVLVQIDQRAARAHHVRCLSHRRWSSLMTWTQHLMHSVQDTALLLQLIALLDRRGRVTCLSCTKIPG